MSLLLSDTVSGTRIFPVSSGGVGACGDADSNNRLRHAGDGKACLALAMAPWDPSSPVRRQLFASRRECRAHLSRLQERGPYLVVRSAADGGQNQSDFNTVPGR